MITLAFVTQVTYKKTVRYFLHFGESIFFVMNKYKNQYIFVSIVNVSISSFHNNYDPSSSLRDIIGNKNYFEIVGPDSHLMKRYFILFIFY